MGINLKLGWVLKPSLTRSFNFLLDLIFPRQCLGCKKEGEWFCPTCFGKLKLRKDETCPFCNKKSQRNFTCPSCQEDKSLKGVFVAGDYHDKALSAAVHLLKYKYCESVAFGLAKFIRKALAKNKKFFSPYSDWLLVPIPLHKKRWRTRGFNQSEVLAKELVKLADFSSGIDLIRRRYYTKPQVGLKARARKKNLEGAFVVIDSRKVEGKKIVLLDDVVTTGSTMEECAKVLQAAGAKEVWGLALAKD